MRLPHAIAMLLAGCAIAIAGTAWSRQPLRLIVPAPPGGTMDIVARVVGQQLASETGQAVVIDNRPAVRAR